MSETVVAVLTPAGSAAVATLGVHGPDAWNVCRSLFTPRSGSLPVNAAEVSPSRFFLGMLGEGLRDEAILALKRSEPVPWVELHCHGGRQMVDVLLEAFAGRGVRVLSWRDWLDRTETSPIRAAAARALALAPTPRTAAILLDQYHGALEAALEAIRTAEPERARQLTAELMRWVKLGQHLTTPWRVVVAGPPNVGKSSLVNALAGYRRCVVSDVPGTTRDAVATLIALDGWPVELIDTAGLREQSEALESAGIGLARREAESADLCVWVEGASSGPAEPPALETTILRVLNKVDLPAAWSATEPERVRVSAATGAGVAELGERIARCLVPEAPPPGAAVPLPEMATV